MRILAPTWIAAVALALGVVGQAPAQNGPYGPSYLAVPAPVGQYGTNPHYPVAQQAPPGYSGPAQAPQPYASHGYAPQPSAPQPYASHAAPPRQLVPAGYYDPADEAYPPPPPPETVYSGPGHFDEALSSPCYEDCDDCFAGFGAHRGMWFGTVGGLILTRDKPNRTWFSAESTNFDNQVLNGQDVTGDWGGGGEVRFGRAFCCGHAIEFTYWTIDPLRDEARVTGSFYNTPIDLRNVTIGTEQADRYIDGSPEHRLWRRNEFHNLELNLIRWPMLTDCQHASVSWLAGARFFRFDESLLFGAVENGFNFGDPANTAYYDVRVVNNLVGFQVGAQANYWFGPRLGLFATPKVGLYGNHIRQRQSLYLGDGTQGFDIRTTKDDISFLAEISVGVNYRITPRWNAYVGYRAVALTGLALADDQVPQFLIDTPEIERIESSGSMILHGAMAGLQFNY